MTSQQPTRPGFLQVLSADWQVCTEVLQPIINEAMEEAGGFKLYKDIPILEGSIDALQKPVKTCLFDCVPDRLKPDPDLGGALSLLSRFAVFFVQFPRASVRNLATIQLCHKPLTCLQSPLTSTLWRGNLEARASRPARPLPQERHVNLGS